MNRLVLLSVVVLACAGAGEAQQRSDIFPSATTKSISPSVDRWFHLRVDGNDGKRVRINLPMTAVQRAISLAPLDEIDHARVSMNGIDFDEDDFDAWRIAVEASRKGPSVFDRNSERVAIRREKGWVVFERRSEWSSGVNEARVPEQLADVVFAPRPIDPQALGAALASMQAGDLFIARGDDSVVRMWVDNDPRAK